MSLPPELKPKPYKLKKGETVEQVMKRHGFDHSDIFDAMKLKHNAKLVKKYKHFDYIPEGETILIPFISLRQTMNLWDAIGNLSWQAKLQKKNTFENGLRDARRAVEEAEKQLTQLFERAAGEKGGEFVKAKRTCEAESRALKQSRATEACIVAANEYVELRDEIDRVVKGAASRREAELANAKRDLQMLETLAPPAVRALDGVIRLSDLMEKGLKELAAQYK